MKNVFVYAAVGLTALALSVIALREVILLVVAKKDRLPGVVGNGDYYTTWDSKAYLSEVN